MTIMATDVMGTSGRLNDGGILVEERTAAAAVEVAP